MQTITTFDNTAEGWERSLYAFLAEKERRSGSRRTVEGYSRMLQHFFGTVGKPPDRVTSAEVFAWGYGVGLSGKQPSSVTIGARLACLSSFYRFLIRMDIVSSNPCDTTLGNLTASLLCHREARSLRRRTYALFGFPADRTGFVSKAEYQRCERVAWVLRCAQDDKVLME